MPSKLLTSSFDSRRKGEESGMSHRGAFVDDRVNLPTLEVWLRLVFVLYLFMREDY